MTADPRAALNIFIAALERHLEASAGRRGEDDPMVIAAYDDLADAFESYDDALLEAYGEMTPLDIYTGSGEDDDDLDDELDLDDDEDEDDTSYGGLDDEDYLEEDDDETEGAPVSRDDVAR